MTERNKIVPHLWFNKEAKEAAHFYASIFPDASVTDESTLHDTPSGDCDVVSFTLANQPFMAISAGPHFKLNPSISFFVNFDPSRDAHAHANLDRLWQHLIEGGTVLMALDEYPFSKHYGWVEDKYGVSWQLILTDPDGDERPFIIPSLLFVGDVCGRAEEAIDFYTSVFSNSSKGLVAHYGPDQAPDKEGSLMFGDFMIENQWFVAMDSAYPHQFAFNEALSLLVNCDTQDEIDYFWEKLSSVPEAEQCGWLKDRFGVSWQINATEMDAMMREGSKEQVARVTQAFLKMKKFNLAELRAAYRG